MLRYQDQHVAHLDDYMPHLSLAQFGGHANLLFASDATTGLHQHDLPTKSGGTLFGAHLLATHLTTLYILQFGALFLLCLVVLIFVLCSEEGEEVHRLQERERERVLLHECGRVCVCFL